MTNETDTQGLSEEEIEALNAHDDDADALREIAGEGGDDHDDGQGGDGGGGAGGGGKDAAGDGAGGGGGGAGDGAAAAGGGDAGSGPGDGDDKGAAGGEGGGEGGEDDADRGGSDVFVPTFEATPPENYEERVAAVKAKEEEADAKFEANEITHAEYRKILRDAAEERQALEKQKLQADMTQDFNKQMGRQRWLWEADRFMDEARRDDGIDYRKDKDLHKKFDMAIRMVAQSDEAKDYTSRQILEEAHAWVKVRVGKGAAPAGKPDGKPDGKPEAKPAPRKPNLAAVPRTLADVPAADRNEVGDDEFADLDKLDGIELESALARMPKDKADRYLKAAG